ncbi:DedA family protein [Streptomyces marispadix]|uniref:VTT domain-containing protein n=1 Tax=Streptomyces marispadix TaxID=2922868 RepID=A0ABS9SXP1_9ACTN|nr:VTT domain-containing protein [Streptomyces marispadix]MCH6161035.1 VTT domain-containing protein [Streptomyces marispadix]
MTALSGMSAALGHVPPGAAYGIVTSAVLAESVLLIGAFVPTLTLLLTAGALARTTSLDLSLVIAAAACAVVAGDFLAHRTGGLLGERLRNGRLACRIPATAWRRAESLTARYGGQAVFLSRFLPVIRTLTPHLTGATRLPYHRIAPYSVTAASLWATGETTLGYAAATSLQQALALGPLLAALAVTAAAGALAWGKLRRGTSRRAGRGAGRRSERGAGRARRAAEATRLRPDDEPVRQTMS